MVEKQVTLHRLGLSRCRGQQFSGCPIHHDDFLGGTDYQDGVLQAIEDEAEETVGFFWRAETVPGMLGMLFVVHDQPLREDDGSHPDQPIVASRLRKGGKDGRKRYGRSLFLDEDGYCFY